MARDVRTLYPSRGVPGKTKFSTAREDTERIFNGPLGQYGRLIPNTIKRGGGKVVPSGHVHGRGKNR